MKPRQAVTTVRREQPARPALAGRIWRVFEYRRPPRPARPRFTT
ncbi:MAG: hypothetical protein ABW245_09010 [Gaiellaceae bacterium]